MLPGTQALLIREANESDVAALVALTAELGYETNPDDVRKRLAEMVAAGDRVVLAECAEFVAGYVTVHQTRFLHCPPTGRVSALVVTEATRSLGVGAQLVAAAEQIARAWGCHRMEVTSNLKRDRAHAFYERLGYSQSSKRFVKNLD